MKLGRPARRADHIRERATFSLSLPRPERLGPVDFVVGDGAGRVGTNLDGGGGGGGEDAQETQVSLNITTYIYIYI